MPKDVVIREKLTAHERKALDVEIGFLEGVLRRAPRFVEALQALGDSYARRGKRLEGLGVDRRLARLLPAEPMVHYNLACSCALNGRLGLGIRALQRAIDCGYRDFWWLARDPDLRPLHAHPRYAEIRERVRALRATARGAGRTG